MSTADPPLQQAQDSFPSSPPAAQHTEERDLHSSPGRKADNQKLANGSRDHHLEEGEVLITDQINSEQDGSGSSEAVKGSRKQATEGIHSVAGADQAKEAVRKSAAGFIFNCPSEIAEECLKKRIFAAKQSSWSFVERIEVGATVFLYDEGSELLHGIFQASTPGTFNLDPTHLKGGPMGGSPYPSQVRVRIKSAYKPAQLSIFSGVRGLVKEGSPKRLEEEPSTRMVENITEEFHRLRRKEKGNSSPSAQERQGPPRSPPRGQRQAIRSSPSPPPRFRRERDWEQLRLRNPPRGRALSPIPPDFEARRRLAADIHIARNFPPHRRLSPPPRRLHSPPVMLDRRSPPPGWLSPRGLSPMRSRMRDWDHPRLPVRLHSPERLHNGREPPLYRSRSPARLSPPRKVREVPDDGTNTTLYLTGIPDALKPNQFIDSLDAAGFRNCYDFFLFEEPLRSKALTVSINMTARAHALLLFRKQADICRGWFPESYSRRGLKVWWHKFQGLESLHRHYDRFADVLPGCPADYSLPMHKPVFFELQPLGRGRKGSKQLHAQPSMADHVAIPSAQHLQLSQPVLQSTGSAASAQDSTSILSALTQLQSDRIGMPGGLPPEVLALLPANTQAQILQAYKAAAQAQAVQQALAGSLPMSFGQLLQAQLLQGQGSQLGVSQPGALQQVSRGLPLSGQGAAWGDGTELERLLSQTSMAASRAHGREEYRPKEETKDRGEKRKPLMNSQLEEDIARRLNSALGEKRLKQDTTQKPRAADALAQKEKATSPKTELGELVEKAENHSKPEYKRDKSDLRESVERREKSEKREKERRSDKAREKAAKTREKLEKHEKREKEKKAKEKSSKHSKDDRRKGKSREADSKSLPGPDALRDSTVEQPAAAEEDEQPSCDAAVDIRSTAQDKVAVDDRSISKQAEDFLSTLGGVKPEQQELGADFLSLE